EKHSLTSGVRPPTSGGSLLPSEGDPAGSPGRSLAPHRPSFRARTLGGGFGRARLRPGRVGRPDRAAVAGGDAGGAGSGGTGRRPLALHRGPSPPACLGDASLRACLSQCPHHGGTRPRPAPSPAGEGRDGHRRSGAGGGTAPEPLAGGSAGLPTGNGGGSRRPRPQPVRSGLLPQRPGRGPG